jgi:hypothetical protein
MVHKQKRRALPAGSEGLSEATPLVCRPLGSPSRSDGSPFWVLIVLLVSAFTAHAHTSDTSYLRAVVSKHSLELRFTFDLSTLYRVARLDANQDGKVTRAEAESAAPAIAECLNQGITLELNETKTALGTLQPLGWPVEAGDAVDEKNYGQTLLHFTFRQDSPHLIEDLYVLYEIFPMLGSQHRAIANFEQEGKRLEVVFTELEPDYIYDTFWRPEAESRAAADPKADFRTGVVCAWTIAGIPLMLLAVGLLLPRKLPVLVMLGAMGWFTWDFFGRMAGMQRNLAIPTMHPELITLGVLAGALVCSVAIVPPLTFLRRSPKQRWFVTVCWVVLIWGALDVTAHVFTCRLGCG